MKGATPLFSILLFFILIVGTIIIFFEEIQKMEYFGRLHTSAIAGVVQQPNREPATSPSTGVSTTETEDTPGDLFSGGSFSVDTFTKNRTIGFGSGRIVNGNVEDVESIETGTVLHTIASGVTDYYAAGFIRETNRIYEPSKYAGLIIFLDRVSGIKKIEPEREYFILLSSNAVREPINITDWKVFDRDRKISYRIPKAVRVIGTDGIQQHTSIQIGKGESIIVSSGRSPVGSSFRINRCTGYRSQFKSFTPSIKTECPDPIDEFIADGSVPFTDSQCYESVDRLRECTAVTKIPTGITRSCRTFLEEVLTESGCVKNHRNDENFLTTEWRLFLESERELWKNTNNVLYLLDEENKLVTTLVYN